MLERLGGEISVKLDFFYPNIVVYSPVRKGTPTSALDTSAELLRYTLIVLSSSRLSLKNDVLFPFLLFHVKREAISSP